MKVLIADQSGVVSLRNVKKKTLEKHYISAGKHYVYRKATFHYNPYEDKFYWVGTKRKNRRYGHKSTIYVRMEPPPEKKVVPVKFYTYFYLATATYQSSPFPRLPPEEKALLDAPVKNPEEEESETFLVTARCMHWKYQNFDFGGGDYPEKWRVGLLSDILHEIMYSGRKDMHGKWKMWRVTERDKVSVGLPEKRKKDKEGKTMKVYKNFKDLIEAIKNRFEEEWDSVKGGKDEESI